MVPPSVVLKTFTAAQSAADAFIRDGMSPIELAGLHRLVAADQPSRVLEIGMANGTSSVVLADALRTYGGHLTSIDPHQSMPRPLGYESAGLRAVRPLLPDHRLIQEYDFLALPALAENGERFDCILVDGFHSFDLTLLDLFYADKLLSVGGLLLCHDSSSPAVYKALCWLEANKPYTRLSPPLYTADWPLWRKLYSRVFLQAERRERRERWQMLAAYRKQAEHAMPEHALTDF